MLDVFDHDTLSKNSGPLSRGWLGQRQVAVLEVSREEGR